VKQISAKMPSIIKQETKATVTVPSLSQMMKLGRFVKPTSWTIHSCAYNNSCLSFLPSFFFKIKVHVYRCSETFGV